MSSSSRAVDLTSRVVLISGSSHGIGRGIAIELARAGSTVLVNGRTAAPVNAVVKEIEAAGHKARALVADLGDEAQISTTIKDIMSAEGRLDDVVLNIGSGRTPNDANPALQETRQVFEVNFFGGVALAHAALQVMKPGSTLTFVSSIAGVEAIGAPIAYTAAKSAILSYAKALSSRAATSGIRINSVSPGNVIFSGSTWDDKLKKDEAAVRQYLKDQVPMESFATPHDIAEAVKFLITAPFITGHNLVVDGGQVRKFI